MGTDSLASLVNEYLEDRRAVLKPRSWDTYRKSGLYWTKRFNHVPSLTEIAEHIRLSLQSGMAPATVNVHISVLRQVWKHAGFPPLTLDKIKQGRKSPMFIDREAFKRVLHNADYRETVFIYFARGAGLRHDEILHLKWEDVCLETGEVRVRSRAWVENGRQEYWSPKSYHERTTFLPEKWLGDVAQYKRGRLRHGLSDWVFGTPGGLRLKSMAKQMRALMKASGCYQEGIMPTHGLRHLFATEMLKNGADIETVRMALGHASIETTQKYLHATAEDVRKAVNNMST